MVVRTPKGMYKIEHRPVRRIDRVAEVRIGSSSQLFTIDLIDDMIRMLQQVKKDLAN